MSHKINWTPEIQDVFETYLGMEENLTFKVIAQRLTEQFGQPFTKNACVGRAHRARLPPRPPRPEVPRKSKEKRMPIRIDAPILPLEAHRMANGRDLTIYQLHAEDCRWPSNEDRPPFTYCGRTAEEGLPYCPDHCAVAYNTPHKR